MKDIVIGWLVFQLVFIGAIFGNVAFEINNDIYNCNKEINNNAISYIMSGIIFPLAMFIGDDDIKNYCSNK